MSQTIDLRKKAELTPVKPPEPIIQPAPEPEPQPVIEAAPAQSDNLEWHTHMVPLPRKDRVYYAAAVLALGGIGMAYFVQDYLFSTVLVLSAIVLVLTTTRPHRKSHVAVHANGISVDGQLHHYNGMHSFWIHYEPQAGLKQLSLEMKKGYVRHIKVPLEDADPVEVRRAMIGFVPEKIHEHSLLDLFMEEMGL